MNRIMVAVMCLLMMAGNAVASDGFALWGMTGDGADHRVEARIGLTRKQVEVGGTFGWMTAQPDWGPDLDFAGGYILYHIDEMVNVTDSDADGMFEGLLHAVTGRPYVGLEALIPCEGDQRSVKLNYVVGTLWGLNDDFTWSIAAEFKTGQGITSPQDDEQNIFTIGARITF